MKRTSCQFSAGRDRSSRRGSVEHAVACKPGVVVAALILLTGLAVASQGDVAAGAASAALGESGQLDNVAVEGAVTHSYRRLDEVLPDGPQSPAGEAPEPMGPPVVFSEEPPTSCDRRRR